MRPAILLAALAIAGCSADQCQRASVVLAGLQSAVAVYDPDEVPADLARRLDAAQAFSAAVCPAP